MAIAEEITGLNMCIYSQSSGFCVFGLQMYEKKGFSLAKLNSLYGEFILGQQLYAPELHICNH